MSRLGRNPFEKKSAVERKPEPPESPAPQSSSSKPTPDSDRDPSLLQWAAIDLPAQLLIGGLKVGLIAHSAWSTWSAKRAAKSSTH